MPVRRVRNTFVHHSDEDAVMSDATTSTVETPDNSAPLTPSRSANGSSSLGKRRQQRQEGQSPARASKRIAAMKSSKKTPDVSPGEIPAPVVSPTHTSIPDTSLLTNKPTNLSLNPLAVDNTFSSSTNMPESSFFSGTPYPASPASPAATEIVLDDNATEDSADEHQAALRAAGIKVRDFAYEPTPKSLKAPEVFDPVPPLIAADWHMRNPEKNRGLLSPKALFRLLKMGWLTLKDVKKFFDPFEYVALAHYNDKPDEQRYPFVVVSHNEAMPTPEQRVRLRRQAGLATHPDDFPDKVFFGYDPAENMDDDEGLGEAPPRALTPPPPPVPVPADSEMISASTPAIVETEAETVVVEEPKPKRRKAKGTSTTKSTTKTRGSSRAKPKGPKPLRRERSRPEV